MLMMICYSSITLFILGKRPRLHSGTRHDAQSHSMEKRNFVAENDPGTNAGSQTESFIKNRYRKCVSTCTPLFITLLLEFKGKTMLALQICCIQVLPDSVAQLDERQTGDQEVAGSLVSCKRMCIIQVNCLED